MIVLLSTEQTISLPPETKIAGQRLGVLEVALAPAILGGSAIRN